MLQHWHTLSSSKRARCLHLSRQLCCSYSLSLLRTQAGIGPSSPFAPFTRVQSEQVGLGAPSSSMSTGPQGPIASKRNVGARLMSPRRFATTSRKKPSPTQRKTTLMAPLEAHLPARKPPAAFNACVEESSVLQTVTRHIGGEDSTLNEVPQSMPADDHPQSAGDDVAGSQEDSHFEGDRETSPPLGLRVHDGRRRRVQR